MMRDNIWKQTEGREWPTSISTTAVTLWLRGASSAELDMK